MLLLPHTYPLPWVLVTYVDTDRCSGFPSETGASGRIIWQTLHFFRNKCNNANSRVSSILLFSDSLRGMAVSRSQYYLNFSNQCTGGHLMAGSSLRASHDSPDGVTAPVAGQVCPMAAGKTWCFLYAIVFHIVRVRSHVSHLLTFTWFSSQIVQAGPVCLTFGHRWPVLFWTIPCFYCSSFQMTDSQTKQHVYYRLGLCCILCTLFLISWTFSAPDGSLWQGSALLGGSTLYTLPQGETMPHMGKARPLLGPSQCICSSTGFVPKVCGASLLDPGLHKSPLVHRRLSKLRVRR